MAIKTKLEDMEIGDMIACRYKAGGLFSELGTCVAPELPLAGSANPDGLFYFRKVDMGLCIADRVVQHSISWDTLNGLRLIQGRVSITKTCPVLTSNDTNGELAFASSIYSTGYDAYKAFTGVLGDYWSSYIGNITSSLGRKFSSAKKFAEYAIVGTNGTELTVCPKSWNLCGSNDNISYTVLHSVDNQVSWKQNEFRTYTIPKDMRGDYLYYRIDILSNNGYSSVTIANLMFNPVICLIRSLAGGNSYLDENGKSSLTDKGLGAFPSNNEWDKYIFKSDLNGSITAGDDKVWDSNSNFPDTIIQDTGVGVSPTWRFIRGKCSVVTNPYVETTGVYGIATGFRPVFEYIEPKSKATTLFY